MKEIPSCIRWQRLLMALTNEEELSHDEQAALNTHLAECATCSQLYQQKQNVLSLLRSRARVAPFPHSVAEQIRLKSALRRGSPLPKEETATRYYQESPVPLATQIQRVYTIDFSFTCSNKRSELIFDDIAASELVIEGILALELIDLFENVLIKDVKVSVALGCEVPVTISLFAQGIAPLITDRDLGMLIEDKLTRAFAELFDSLRIERCAVG